MAGCGRRYISHGERILSLSLAKVSVLSFHFVLQTHSKHFYARANIVGLGVMG